MMKGVCVCVCVMMADREDVVVVFYQMTHRDGRLGGGQGSIASWL